MAVRPREGAQAFAQRKFCSHKCSYVHKSQSSRLRWNGARDKQPLIRETIPAATEAEWLRLNGGPTRCPDRYAAPVEHSMYARHALTGSGRVR